MTQEQYSAVCPYLGLADDADSHATYATEAHRCYRLPNPTRIASPHQESYCLGANHVTCPVYQGEGVPQTQQPRPASTPTGAVAAGAAGAAGAAAVGAAAAGTPPAEVPTVKGPPPGQPSRPPTTTAPKKPSGSAGQLGPRPRSGGISMPVATIGLFGLAIVIIALAFGIQQLVGGDDDDETSGDSAVETADALNKTSTAQAGDQPTQPPAETQQPNGTRTPGASVTPGTGTPSSGGGTYTVRPGDTCGSIAEEHGVTLDELLEANDMTEADCNTLQIGEELIIPG